LLAEKNPRHERADLGRLREDGRTVVEIESSGTERDWRRDADRTLDAMRAGANVIYEGVLIEDDWCGVADFPS
jgi:hypothetical protein